MRIAYIVIVVFSIVPSSYANLTSIHRGLRVDSGKGVLIGNKQRAILVPKRKIKTTVTTRTKNSRIVIERIKNRTLVSAEPSHGVLSAHALAVTA